MSTNDDDAGRIMFHQLIHCRHECSCCIDDIIIQYYVLSSYSSESFLDEELIDLIWLSEISLLESDISIDLHILQEFLDLLSTSPISRSYLKFLISFPFDIMLLETLLNDPCMRDMDSYWIASLCAV